LFWKAFPAGAEALGSGRGGGIQHHQEFPPRIRRPQERSPVATVCISEARAPGFESAAVLSPGEAWGRHVAPRLSPTWPVWSAPRSPLPWRSQPSSPTTCPSMWSGPLPRTPGLWSSPTRDSRWS